MTSSTDMSQHPEVSEISDLTEGLLSPSRAADVLTHVDGCDVCTEVRDSLEEIRGLLGTLPDPGPMPADIASRIDDALAAETRAATPHARDPLSVSRETERGQVSRETERGQPGAREAEAQEAASREADARETPESGGALKSGTADRSSSAVRTPGVPSSDRPPGRSSASTRPGRRPTRRRRTAVLGTAFGAALIGMSVFLLQTQDSGTVADQGASTAERSTHSYSGDTLEAQVQRLLDHGDSSEDSGARTPPKAETKSSSEDDTPDTQTSRNPLSAPVVPVPTCVQRATGRTTPALALDEGRYQGQNAFLVVLPHASDPARVQAYVVAASCVDTAPESPGRLLLTHVYKRP